MSLDKWVFNKVRVQCFKRDTSWSSVRWWWPGSRVTTSALWLTGSVMRSCWWGAGRPIIFDAVWMILWNLLLPESTVKKQMLPQKWLLSDGIRWAGHQRKRGGESFFYDLTFFFSPPIIWHFFLQRLCPWTLAVAWFWIRAHVGTITSAGTTTNRPTPAPSSGTEAVAATRTALTQKRSARGRVWSPDPQVHCHESSQPY